jgi:hypothetical protein
VLELFRTHEEDWRRGGEGEGIDGAADEENERGELIGGSASFVTEV